MAEVDNELELVNESLAAIGASSINSFDEETGTANAVNKTWPGLRNTCLSLHNWSFATKTYKLERRTATPNNGWTYGFDFPGGIIGGPQMVLKSIKIEFDTLRHFAVEDKIVFTNEKELWAQFRVKASIELWSPEFRTAVVIGHASRLAVPVAHDEKLAADLREQAFGRPIEAMRGGLMGAAITLDRSKHPVASPFLRTDPLTMARYE